MTWSFRGDYLKNLRIIEPALDYISRSTSLKRLAFQCHVTASLFTRVVGFMRFSL